MIIAILLMREQAIGTLAIGTLAIGNRIIKNPVQTLHVTSLLLSP
jgi:hypothetical protein